MGYAVGLIGRAVLRTGLAVLTVPVWIAVVVGTLMGVLVIWGGLAGLLGWWSAPGTSPHAAMVNVLSGALLLAVVSLIRVAWADLQAAARREG